MRNRWECDMCGHLFDPDPNCVFDVYGDDEGGSDRIEITAGSRLDAAAVPGGSVMLCDGCQRKAGE